MRLIQIIIYTACILLLGYLPSGCNYKKLPASAGCLELEQAQFVGVTVASSCNNRYGAFDMADQSDCVSYSIDGINFQKGDSFDNPALGNYNLTVRNSLGCQVESAIVIDNEGGLNISLLVDRIDCGSRSGILTTTPDQGISPVPHSMDEGSVQDRPVFDGLDSEEYRIFTKYNAGFKLQHMLKMATEIGFASGT